MKITIEPTHTQLGSDTSWTPNTTFASCTWEELIKAFLNGWKISTYNSGTSVTDEATGQLADAGTHTFANAGGYNAISVTKSSDDITYEAAVENVDYTLSNLDTTAVLTNTTGLATYFKISYTHSIDVTGWVGLDTDSTAPDTNTLAYVTSTKLLEQNADANFYPYKVIYQYSYDMQESLTPSGALMVYPGQNNIIFPQIAGMTIETLKNADVVSDIYNMLQTINDNLDSLDSRVTSLENA